MDPRKMGMMIAVGGPKAPAADGAMDGDEAMQHGSAAMQELAEALKSGDFKSAFHAFSAAAACCDDGDEEAEAPDQGAEE